MAGPFRVGRATGLARSAGQLVLRQMASHWAHWPAGRVAPGALLPRWQDRCEATGEEGVQFLGAEEVDVQAVLGSGEVADGKPAVRVAFGHLVFGPDVGGGGVDPQAEQATRGNPFLRGADARVRRRGRRAGRPGFV